MLGSLYVKNYAIIDEVTISFRPGYNVITGETGAGKSILLGALGLIMGNRADRQVLHDPKSKCIVEAVFQIEAGKIKELPASDAYEPDREMVLRREISNSGKSRAFINDSLVTVNEMKTLATSLVEVHNQFDSLSIMYPEYQLSVVDSLSGSEDLLSVYSGIYTEYKNLKTDIEKLKRQQHQGTIDLEYHLFQLKDLEKIPLDGMDEAALEEEFKTLSHSEEIKSVLQSLVQDLTDNESSLEERIIALRREVQTVASFSGAMAGFGDRLEEIITLVTDLSTDASRQFDELGYSEERLAELQDLLDHIYALQNKHRVQSLNDLIGIRDDLRKKTSNTEQLDLLIAEKEKNLISLKSLLQDAASNLSKKRIAAFPEIRGRAEDLLRKMAMPNARVQFEHRETDDFTVSGKDEIVLVFSANKGVTPKAVSEIASGGEISRLALCIKSMIAGHIEIDTLIFDEIDTGISGSVAVKVAEILDALASQHQVIAITHSPQVAAMAKLHFFVYKQDLDHRTVTKVKELDREERVEELAKMLSTDPPSDSARSNALELLEMSAK